MDAATAAWRGAALGLLLAACTLTGPVAARDDVVLLRVPFVSGSDQLGPLARARLDMAIPRLKSDYLGSPIEIAGHADGFGSPSENRGLSARRALAVRAYLEANGVEVKFMIDRGYGASQPIADNDTYEGRFRNRRVELRLRQGTAPGDLDRR